MTHNIEDYTEEDLAVRAINKHFTWTPQEADEAQVELNRREYERQQDISYVMAHIDI